MAKVMDEVLANLLAEEDAEEGFTPDVDTKTVIRRGRAKNALGRFIDENLQAKLDESGNTLLYRAFVPGSALVDTKAYQESNEKRIPAAIVQAAVLSLVAQSGLTGDDASTLEKAYRKRAICQSGKRGDETVWKITVVSPSYKATAE